MKKSLLSIALLIIGSVATAQLKWENVDSLFQPLPASVHVYRTTEMLDGKPNIAYYVEADLNDKKLDFLADTTVKRRFTPLQYHNKLLAANKNPLVVVNTTFFSFATNQNLNIVMTDGKLLSYNVHSIPGRGRDTFTYRHALTSAIGIDKKRKADVAYIYTDSSKKNAYATQKAVEAFRDSIPGLGFSTIKAKEKELSKWKMKTAVGGGPSLLTNGEINVTNNQELKFGGKAIDDKHPRTAMGYTRDNKLIILVVEGRNAGKAEGASLTQLAKMFRDIGCVEALNLDGGGSSCMLVNGKPTIKVSDPGGQRPVPAVFVVGGRL